MPHRIVLILAAVVVFAPALVPTSSRAQVEPACECPAFAEGCEIIASGNPPNPECAKKKDARYRHIEECFSVTIPEQAKIGSVSPAIRERVAQKLGLLRPVSKRQVQDLLNGSCPITLDLDFVFDDPSCRKSVLVWYSGPNASERGNTFHILGKEGQTSDLRIEASASCSNNVVADAINELVQEELAVPGASPKLDILFQHFQDLGPLCDPATPGTLPCEVPLASLPPLEMKRFSVRFGRSVRLTAKAQDPRDPDTYIVADCDCPEPPGPEVCDPVNELEDIVRDGNPDDRKDVFFPCLSTDIEITVPEGKTESVTVSLLDNPNARNDIVPRFESFASTCGVGFTSSNKHKRLAQVLDQAGGAKFRLNFVAEEQGRQKPTVWYRLGGSDLHFQSSPSTTSSVSLDVDYAPGASCTLDHILRILRADLPSGGVKVNVAFEGLSNASTGPTGDSSFDADNVAVEVGEYKVKIKTTGGGVHARFP